MSRNVLITCINFNFICFPLYLFVCSFKQMTRFTLLANAYTCATVQACSVSSATWGSTTTPRCWSARAAGTSCSCRCRRGWGPAGASCSSTWPPAWPPSSTSSSRASTWSSWPTPCRAHSAPPPTLAGGETCEATLRLRCSAPLLLEGCAVITNNTWYCQEAGQRGRRGGARTRGRGWARAWGGAWRRLLLHQAVPGRPHAEELPVQGGMVGRRPHRPPLTCPLSRPWRTRCGCCARAACVSAMTPTSATPRPPCRCHWHCRSLFSWLAGAGADCWLVVFQALLLPLIMLIQWIKEAVKADLSMLHWVK